MFFLLPFGNDRRTLRSPVVTYALIAANILLYAYLIAIDRSGSAIAEMGISASAPSTFKIITAMFTHAGILHLAWNMLFLWLFGPNVEDALGRLRYLALYIASGFAAAYLNVWIVRLFIPDAVNVSVVGASGAIAGVLGVFAIRFYETRIRVLWIVGILFCPLRWGTFTVPAIIGLGFWFAQQLAGGILSVAYPVVETTLFIKVAHRLLPDGIAYWSHIGGMGVGMLLASLFNLRLHGTREYLLNKAEASMQDGITWQAAEHLCSLLQSDPNNAEVHAGLAKAYAIQRDADLAVPHYQKSIHILLQRSNPSRATEIFEELRSFYRNARLDLRTEYTLARFLSDSGQYEAAYKLFDEIASTYPNTPEGEIALMKAAEISTTELNKLDDGIRLCSRFMKEYPHSPMQPTVSKFLADAITATDPSGSKDSCNQHS